MALITKANAAHYRRLSIEAKTRNKLARERAQAEIAACVQSGITGETRSKIESSLRMLADLVAQEIAGGAKGRVRLQDLLKCQGILLAQVRSLQGEPEPARAPRAAQVRPVVDGEQGPGKVGSRVAPVPACGVSPTISSVPVNPAVEQTPQLL